MAVEHETKAVRINEALRKRGVIPDFRFPNVIRLAPVALYNTYHEIWKAVHHLKATVDLREYEGFSGHRGPVA